MKSICELCGGIIQHESEIWTYEDQEIKIDMPDEVACLIKINGKSIEICNSCYKKNKHDLFPVEIRALIEHEFALEFHQRGLHQSALDAAEKAVSLAGDPIYKSTLNVLKNSGNQPQ